MGGAIHVTLICASVTGSLCDLEQNHLLRCQSLETDPLSSFW